MKKTKLARRKVIGGIGATVATMAISPVFSGPKTLTPGFSATQDLEDPTTKYPKPPFSSQSQPWPGLAGKTDPRPDHGEKSYKGSYRSNVPVPEALFVMVTFSKVIFFRSTTSIIFKKH